MTFENILTGSQNTLIPGSFGPIALDPKTGTLLVLVPTITDEYRYLEQCGSLPDPGLYLYSAFGSKAPIVVPFKETLAGDALDYSAGWSPEAKSFFLTTKTEIFSIDLQGQIQNIGSHNTYSGGFYPESNFPVVSPNGREWVMFGYDGLWIYSPDYSPKRIYERPVDDVLWYQDGSALLFISEDMIYQVTFPIFSFIHF